jgi:hypothetical protein
MYILYYTRDYVYWWIAKNRKWSDSSIISWLLPHAIDDLKYYLAVWIITVFFFYYYYSLLFVNKSKSRYIRARRFIFHKIISKFSLGAYNVLKWTSNRGHTVKNVRNFWCRMTEKKLIYIYIYIYVLLYFIIYILLSHWHKPTFSRSIGRVHVPALMSRIFMYIKIY